MSSLALEIFDRCLGQVKSLQNITDRPEYENVAALRRSGLILTVAALDSYFHERAIGLLYQRAQSSPANAAAVANYVGNFSGVQLASATGRDLIRYRLSFKTLASPIGIDRMLTAAGLDSEATWLAVALACGTRPDRMRRVIDLAYDRRNMIAHEADWDPVQLEFRNLEVLHLEDFVRDIRQFVETVDSIL